MGECTTCKSSRSVDVNHFPRSMSSADGYLHFIFHSVIAAFSSPTFLVSVLNGMIVGVIIYSCIPLDQPMGMPPDILSVHTYQLTELSRKILLQSVADPTVFLFFLHMVRLKGLFTCSELSAPAFLLS